MRQEDIMAMSFLAQNKRKKKLKSKAWSEKKRDKYFRQLKAGKIRPKMPETW